MAYILPQRHGGAKIVYKVKKYIQELPISLIQHSRSNIQHNELIRAYIFTAETQRGKSETQHLCGKMNL